MTPRTFWMVWVSHKSGPTKRHPSLESAEREAVGLARLPENIGRKVYILEAIQWATAEETPVRFTHL